MGPAHIVEKYKAISCLGPLYLGSDALPPKLTLPLLCCPGVNNQHDCNMAVHWEGGRVCVCVAGGQWGYRDRDALYQSSPSAFHLLSISFCLATALIWNLQLDFSSFPLRISFLSSYYKHSQRLWHTHTNKKVFSHTLSRFKRHNRQLLPVWACDLENRWYLCLSGMARE